MTKPASNSFNDYCNSVGSALASNVHCNVNPLLYVNSNAIINYDARSVRRGDNFSNPFYK